MLSVHGAEALITSQLFPLTICGPRCCNSHSERRRSCPRITQLQKTTKDYGNNYGWDCFAFENALWFSVFPLRYCTREATELRQTAEKDYFCNLITFLNITVRQAFVMSHAICHFQQPACDIFFFYIFFFSPFFFFFLNTGNDITPVFESRLKCTQSESSLVSRCVVRF